jgi:chromosome segregation ATPase
MTKPELQQALDESLNFCSEYRKIIESQERKLAGKEEEIRQLEAMLLEKDQQLKRFSEAYGKLKGGLEFYMPQIEEWKRQKYDLKKRYETALEEHTKTLMEEFAVLKQRYEETARREIAKAVASVKANEKSAEEICSSFALGLLRDFEQVLPAAASKP